MQEYQIRRWIIASLTLELAVFGWIFFGGPYNIRTVTAAEHQNNIFKNRNVALVNELDVLKEEVAYWNSDFAKEKYAREQLHMARKNDIIYELS